MKQIATYNKTGGGKLEIEYDDESPCLICGEPVIGASMGGTAICGWCDNGKCRYCGMATFILREEIDGGASKKDLLQHMKWHRERQPDFNEKALKFHRELMEDLKKGR